MCILFLHYLVKETCVFRIIQLEDSYYKYLSWKYVLKLLIITSKFIIIISVILISIIVIFGFRLKQGKIESIEWQMSNLCEVTDVCELLIFSFWDNTYVVWIKFVYVLYSLVLVVIICVLILYSVISHSYILYSSCCTSNCSNESEYVLILYLCF